MRVLRSHIRKEYCNIWRIFDNCTNYYTFLNEFLDVEYATPSRSAPKGITDEAQFIRARP